jgi:hypothetical protein
VLLLERFVEVIELAFLSVNCGERRILSYLLGLFGVFLLELLQFLLV